MKLRLLTKKAGIFILLFLFFSVYAVTAQSQKKITGTVLSSEDNMPLPGASVVVKGTTNGTSTDFDGKFSLDIVSNGTTLVISYVGYQQKEVTITNSPLTIILQVDTSTLDEVVVVGYGTLKRSDIAGSVASVKVEDAVAIPTTNVAEMLRGRAAGVQVNLSDARPGGSSNILIRGQTSVNVGNAPLIIVDGLPFNDINDVVADDVKSIEILKDASATAIYGSRASNGVILITTKRGREGKIAIDYHGYTTTQSLTRNFDLYNPSEFAQLRREAIRTSEGTPDFLDDTANFEPFELEALQNGSFVNWEDLVLQNALIQNHTLSLSAGSEKTKIFASAGYFAQDGLIPTSGFERGSLRVNIDQKVSDKLSIQANVNFITSEQDRETNSINFITISPLAIPFDTQGNLNRYPLGPGTTTVNPLWNVRESDDRERNTLTDLNFVGKYDFTSNFSYKLSAFLRRESGDRGIYRSRLHPSGENFNGSAVLTNTANQEYQIENIFNYKLHLNDTHKFDFTAVQSVNERSTQETGITKTGFPNDLLSFNGDASEVFNPVRNLTKRRLISFLGRVNYNLSDKYLLTLTGRYDGSSVLAQNNKWAFFPAAALAWKIHNEAFLKDSESINELKLRVTYGLTGNQGVGSTRTLGVADELPYIFGGNTFAGFLPLSRLPNPNLKWETQKTMNIGVDFGLFNNLFTGTFEYYRSETEDLLLDRVLSGTSGFSVTTFNIGNIENKGVELSLTSNIIRKKDFNWSVTTIFSKNENKVTALNGEVDLDGNPIDLPSQGLFINEPINNTFQYEFEGIFQTQEEIDASPQANQTAIAPGSIRVIDQNGDGEITNDDRIVISEDPDWYGSISTSLRYKGFELFADFFIVEGATRVNPYLAEFNFGGTLSSKLNGIRVPYWTPENPSNSYPRPNFDTQDPFLYALAVQDASYVRLRTLTLGYNIPQSVLGKIGLRSAKIYGTATNLFTITDYKSYSPEQNPGNFPEAKALTLGLKLGF